jgi:uncharacterized damage-inducible protein DinB
MRDLLIQQSQASYQELLDSLDGVSEALSWAVPNLKQGEYLHTEGILSIIVHVAGCKVMYGSAAFRNLEHRWRDVKAKIDPLWPSLEAAKAYLQEAQEYWLSSWAGEEDFNRLVKTNWNDDWPAWKVLWMVQHHDAYHAGQVQLLRTMLQPTDIPPPSETETWERHASPYSW